MTSTSKKKEEKRNNKKKTANEDLTVRLREQERKASTNVTGAGETSEPDAKTDSERGRV